MVQPKSMKTVWNDALTFAHQNTHFGESMQGPCMQETYLVGKIDE